jgi:2-polyprenyl-3-methyl-5-hydroxy-6-metoxy-1,4-benzoquinol methylase
MPDLRVRTREPELMDDPSLDAARHARALEALARINRVSRTGARVAREVQRIAGEARTGRRAARESAGGAPARASSTGRIRVLDVACGGGDVLRDVARRMGRAGIEVELHGCDVSAVALEHARRRSAASPMISFERRDVLDAPLPGGFDLVTCSLFLHHLEDGDAARLLGAMAEAGRALLLQDLRRTRAGHALAWIGLHTLTRSDVARVDGLRSVRAAFTLAEARRLCDRAGLEGAAVSASWPQRLEVFWRAA